MLKPVVVLSLFAFLALGSAMADAAPSKCPVKIGDQIHTYTHTRYTRQNRGVFSYTIDSEGNFQVADGIARPYRLGDRLGKVRMSCEESSMIFESWADGSERIHRVKMTPLSQTKLKIESTKEGRTGIYHKI